MEDKAFDPSPINLCQRTNGIDENLPILCPQKCNTDTSTDKQGAVRLAMRTATAVMGPVLHSTSVLVLRKNL